MAYGDFNNTDNLQYDWYQRDLASMFWKKSSESGATMLTTVATAIKSKVTPHQQLVDKLNKIHLLWVTFVELIRTDLQLISRNNKWIPFFVCYWCF